MIKSTGNIVIFNPEEFLVFLNLYCKRERKREMWSKGEREKRKGKKKFGVKGKGKEKCGVKGKGKRKGKSTIIC